MEMIKNCSILATRGQTRNKRRIPRRVKPLISLSVDLNLSRPQPSSQIKFKQSPQSQFEKNPFATRV